MWPLFRAEMKYNMPIIWSILICSVLGFLAIHFWPVITGELPSNQNSGGIFLSLMVAYFIISLLSNPWGKERRTRQYIRLPVSLHQIRISHFLLYVLFWCLLVINFLLFTWISHYFVLDSATFLILCVQTGVAFFIYGFFGAMSLFRESAGRKVLEISVPLFFLFISIAGSIHVLQGQGDSFFVDRVLSWLYRSKLSASLWLICGLALAFIVVLFLEQKSYTDT